MFEKSHFNILSTLSWPVCFLKIDSFALTYFLCTISRTKKFKIFAHITIFWNYWSKAEGKDARICRMQTFSDQELSKECCLYLTLSNLIHRAQCWIRTRSPLMDRLGNFSAFQRSHALDRHMSDLRLGSGEFHLT